MKKIFNILLIIFVCSDLILAQNGVEAAMVSYRCINKPLPLVLRELSKASGVNIVFSESKIKSKKTVTIGASNERLLDVLQVICKPYRLTTEVIGNAIAIVSEKYDELDSEYIISGYIKDGRDGEVLPYTAVYLADKTTGVFSNEKGFYSFKLRRGNYKIIYAYVGYQDDTLQLFLRKDTTIMCKMKTENQLAEIVIEENLTRTTERYGETFYSKDRISTAMMFAGEADVIRTINSTAGVSTASDGFGGMSVRGGNYDQNLILYDGVPIQNTGHAFGLISIFNSSIIQDARLIKGGFPARYGGRLSSILDIKTRNGNNKAFKGEVSLSTIASRVMLEGPLSKDKASFLLSYRRTFADPWIKELSQYIIQTGDAQGETSYYFDDINGKLSFALSPKHQLSLSYYKGRDALKNSVSSKKMSSNIEYDYNSINDQGWGNRLASIHLNSQLGNNMYSKIIAYTSKWENDAYNFRRFAVDSSSIIEDIYTADYKLSNLSNTGMRWDVDAQFSKGNIMRFGAGFIQNQYSPMFNLLSNVNNGTIYPEVITKEGIKSRTNGASYQSEEILAYVEDEFDAGSNVVLNVGLHSSLYLFSGSRYVSLQPRFSMNINGEASWFNFSSSMLRQYHQALSDNGLGFPSDQWVSASKWIKPADAIITSTTFGFLLSKNASWSFGGYYKYMDNIISLGEGEVLNLEDGDNWQKRIPRGTGKSYGVETTINLTGKTINFEFNATYGKATRQFEDLNNGKPYLYKYDRTFMTNTAISLKLGGKSEMNVFFTYQKGSSTSIPTGGIFEREENGQKYLYPVFEGKNNFRFPDFIRLDAGFTFVGSNKIGSHKIFIGIYNILNRKNPVYLDISRNNFNLNVYEVSKVSIFPVLPSISYTLIIGK